MKGACLPILGKKIYFVNWAFFSKCFKYPCMVSYRDGLKNANIVTALYLFLHIHKRLIYYLPTLILILELSSLQYSDKGGLCSLLIHIRLFASILPNSYSPIK